MDLPVLLLCDQSSQSGGHLKYELQVIHCQKRVSMLSNQDIYRVSVISWHSQLSSNTFRTLALSGISAWREPLGEVGCLRDW